MRQLSSVLVAALLALLTTTAYAAERTTYFVPDALGSPVAAMDEQGNLLWRESYTPYGERRTNSPANTANPAYTGKPEDTDTGLVYMGARWYDPEAARFMGVDPQGFDEGNPQSFGRYGYANNSPYRYVDPDGESAVEAITELIPQAGRSIASLIAYGVGLINGDTTLQRAALNGMRADSSNALSALASTASPIPGGTLLRAGSTAGKRGVPEPKAGQKLYRVYGGDSSANGASWSTVDPSSRSDFRDAAGLPSGGDSGVTNTGRFVLEATLLDPSRVIKTRKAVPLDGKRGGVPEYIIPNAIYGGAVRVDRVSGANPEF